MKLSRRSLLAAPLGAAALAADPQRWTARWDRAILTAAVERTDPAFDPAENLLRQKLGPEYHYHTNLRDASVHPTRESLDYALLLLETNDDARRQRALAILDRVLALQDAGPDSRWLGLWGYYSEEPASKMSPADWNWADFLGALLLEVEFRHGAKLPAGLRQLALAAIRLAAGSVRQRNVAMTYTNIAVQGTFVTLAAAELLNDSDLKQYAQDRLTRLARAIDETGGFSEYNSPTYSNVTIANLTRIRMYVKDAAARKLALAIEERAWLHLSRHWHPPTRQLAGPMSRCYSTDIGYPFWIQKALSGAIGFASLDELADRNPPGDVARLDYRCSEDSAAWFLLLEMDREHRELFANAPAGVEPLQGATFLGLDHCLGSVNRGSFWVQSRPLVGYWGGPDRPGRYLQARLLKDDYDFASGLFYSVQSKNFVLGAAAFRSPGGDRHPSLDPVKDGEFTCARLRLRLDLAQVPFNAPMLVNGQDADLGEYPAGSRFVVDVGGALLYFKPVRAAFGEPAGRLTLAREQGLLTVSVDFLSKGAARAVRWPDAAFCAFALAMHAAEGTLEDYDQYMDGFHLAHRLEGGSVKLVWKTAWSDLALESPTGVAAVDAMDRAFRSSINAKAVPVERLSSRKLL